NQIGQRRNVSVDAQRATIEGHPDASHAHRWSTKRAARCLAVPSRPHPCQGWQGTGGGWRAVDPRSDTARSDSTSASSIISAIKARAARIAGAGFTQAVLVLRSEHEVANVVHLTSLLGEIAGEVARPEVHQLLSARGCQWQTHLG